MNRKTPDDSLAGEIFDGGGIEQCELKRAASHAHGEEAEKCAPDVSLVGHHHEDLSSYIQA